MIDSHTIPNDESKAIERDLRRLLERAQYRVESIDREIAVLDIERLTLVAERERLLALLTSQQRGE